MEVEQTRNKTYYKNQAFGTVYSGGGMVFEIFSTVEKFGTNFTIKQNN